MAWSSQARDERAIVATGLLSRSVQWVRIASIVVALCAIRRQWLTTLEPTDRKVHDAAWHRLRKLFLEEEKPMKPLKLALTSFVIGVALSAASIAAYACAREIYVQDQSDRHMYTRYVLVGSSGGGGVEICLPRRRRQ
jgi:hypothetical protein